MADSSLQVTQQLKSKAWADIVEALIGCIYLEAGENAAMEFLVYLGIISEVPRGFERQPQVQITEANMDDDQLAVDIAAAENAAAAVDTAVDAGPATETAAAADTAVQEADGDVATAAEPAGAEDVLMADAVDSASACPESAHGIQQAASASGAEAATAALATAEAEQVTASGNELALTADGKSADCAAAASANGTEDDSQAEGDIIMDQSGYGNAASHASHGSSHAAEALEGSELSVASANGQGASAAEMRSDAETCNGVTKLSAASGLTSGLLANGHAKQPMASKSASAGLVSGFDDPSVINICEENDDSNAAAHTHGHMAMLEPKQEPDSDFQPGYLMQSGYGDIDLTSSDSDESDSAGNPEEVSLAKEEEEGEIALPLSPSHSDEQPMDTGPVGIGAVAPGLAGGAGPALPSASGLLEAAPVQSSGDIVKIKPGLKEGSGAGVDQAQIELDALAFLAGEDDDSEDELPQARPHRGQVSLSMLFEHCCCLCASASVWCLGRLVCLQSYMSVAAVEASVHLCSLCISFVYASVLQSINVACAMLPCCGAPHSQKFWHYSSLPLLPCGCHTSGQYAVVSICTRSVAATSVKF